MDAATDASFSPHDARHGSSSVLRERSIFLITESAAPWMLLQGSGESRGEWVAAGPHLAMGAAEDKAQLLLFSWASAMLCSKESLCRVT